MDTLMKLVGLREIKERAIAVALTVLLDPPPDLKTGTSMVNKMNLSLLLNVQLYD